MDTTGSRAVWIESLPAEWQSEVADGGSLDAFAWPGGYPLYYVTADGMEICAECASYDGVDHSQRPVARGVHWEGEPITCEDCGKDIESAYGDPDEDRDEPDEDAICSDDGLHWYQYGNLVLTIDEDADRDAELRAYMDRAQFWPNVYVINDHGNSCLINVWGDAATS